jgi:excisionase family DNA binding protein
MEDQERLTLTILEASRQLGISRGLTYQLAREGKLPVIRLGQKRLLIPRAKLLRWIEGDGRAGNVPN